jgi:glycosyltransferase involved in cell wall biosynthesis
LAKELNKAGHEVTIIASSNHHLINQKISNHFDTWQDEFVKFILLPSLDYQDNSLQRLGNMLSFAWQTLQLPKKIAQRPDIIIGSSVHPFAVWSAKKLANQYKIPFCFEVRDLWPQTLIDMKVIGYYHPFAIILRLLEAYLYQQANLIITLLPYAYEYISRFKIPQEKVVYLPNGVDLDLFSNVQLEQKKCDHLTVMYLGSHGSANGLDTLIEAANILEKEPNSQLIKWRFIGNGNQKQNLQNQIDLLGLTTVTLEDSISKKQVPYTINQADILVVNLLNLKIYQYGISLNKLFEYLVSQKPIVFGCAARNNPVAEANAGITIAPEDAQAMANAIREIVALPVSERTKMGQRGRAYVEKYHSYANLGQQLNTLLKEVVKEHTKP